MLDFSKSPYFRQQNLPATPLVGLLGGPHNVRKKRRPRRLSNIPSRRGQPIFDPAIYGHDGQNAFVLVLGGINQHGTVWRQRGTLIQFRLGKHQQNDLPINPAMQYERRRCGDARIPSACRLATAALEHCNRQQTSIFPKKLVASSNW